MSEWWELWLKEARKYVEPKEPQESEGETNYTILCVHAFSFTNIAL